MNPMWAQGQYILPLKCIGIWDNHVLYVSPHVTNHNAMYSISKGHFTQNVKQIPSAQREELVLEMPRVHRKVDLWSEVKMSREASFLSHDTELPTLQVTGTTTSCSCCPWNDKKSHLEAMGPAKLVLLRTMAMETGSKQDSWEKSLWFSIINEKKSKQISIEESWGLLVHWRWEEYIGTYYQKLQPHRPFKVSHCIVYLSILHGEMPLRVEGAERCCASMMDPEMHLYVGGIMRAETYSSATKAEPPLTSAVVLAEQLKGKALYICAVCWWHVH